MKSKAMKYNLGAALLLAGLGFSCTSEDPFTTEGTGIVRMNVAMNSTATRANVSEEVLKDLQEKCVVYISDQEGLLHKWVGVQNIPAALSLKYDTYTAEAWSGDSVSASFESKFFKGATTFNVNAQTPTQNVVINCRIVNVVVSVNNSTINQDLMKNVTVNVSNTGGSLDFENETLTRRGYFMMPDNDTELRYVAVVTGFDGNEVRKEGVIENVIKGHHYILNFTTEPVESTNGGAFFDIVVKEYNEEVPEEVVIYGKPSFSWSNPNLKVDGQIVHIKSEGDNFNSEILRVAAYNDGFESLLLETGDMSSYFDNNTSFDLVNIVNNNYDSYLDQLSRFGVDVRKGEGPNSEGLHVWQIIFSADLFNNLAESPDEYVMNLTATDKSGKSNSMRIRVANTEGAVRYEDPIVVDERAFKADYTAVSVNSARIPVNIVDGSQYLALQYKEQNDNTWTTLPVIAGRASTEVEITGLKENTEYEYRVVGGMSQDSLNFESSIYSFTTETKFQIPNHSLENWYRGSDNAYVPMPDSSQEFWDTGNHGATQFLKDKNMTVQNTDYFHSGTSSACLTSQYIVVKFAAGNLFVGKFLSTVGTKGAALTFGQPYNGSHPKALRVYVNYRPGTVNYSEIDDLKKNETDKAQIYIALANAPSSINTGNGVMFDPKGSNILAYGEHTFKANFGDDGVLEAIEIPIDYYERAKSTQLSHIIIVCSASKYGDYFTGSSNSVMYLDDFELVY